MTDLVETLQRWEDAGGLWRVLDRRADHVVVGLFRCDGGEQLDEFRSADQRLIDFLGDRRDNLA
ncbi:MAG: hypothetical protein HYZ38_24960 [Mycobacterium sp.]|nr:hypothetical protein [Mycobacterium sp.]